MMRSRLAAVASSLVLLVAAPAAAQLEVEEDSEPKVLTNVVEAGLFFGGFIANGDHEFYDFGAAEHDELKALSFAVGVRGAYFPLRYVGFEVEAEWEPTSTEMSGGASLLGLSGHFLGQYQLEQVTPFVVVGLGTLGVVSDNSALGDDADLVSYYGVGVKHTLQPWLTIRADARLIAAPKRGAISGSTVHGEILLGASYTFDIGPKPAEPLPPPQPLAEPEPEPEPEPEDPPEPVDPDGDGFVAARDECPDVAGDPPNGCPREDGDGDGIRDEEDKCPAKAETKNGFEDEDGCPDEVPDSDGDGLADDADQCKDQAEDADGYEDEDGCPDGDNDGDGLLDASDDCPIEEGPAENRGCPDKDRDKDGVVDREDNCPDEAGTAENHGCKEKQLAVIKDTKIELLDKVYFRTNSARIRRRSNALLANIAKLLKAHPEIKKVRIEGHTDDRGGEEYNKKLSQRRAQSVADYLAREGVARERLMAVGKGEEAPIEENDTRSGRRANRRVEFNIVKDDD